MKKRLLLCLSILLLLACQRLPAPTPQPTATFLPEPTAVPPTSTATATATAEPTATATPIPPTPTATAVPATAELWLAEEWSLERYPADQPITIHFSTPMDVESSDNPLSITPRLSGGRAWDESRTTFTFTPNEFMEATTYTLHLSDNLRTAAGDPIPNRPEWQLSSLGATTVIALPSTGTTFNTPRPILALSFGQTMDTASVEQALQITPNLPYETSWSNSNPRVVDILLQAPMQLGVVYTLSLSQTVYSTQGAMVPAQTWEYALTEPTLRAVPPTAENRSAPLILQPNYEMSFFRGLTQSLEIEPEVDGVWVEGLTHWFFTPEGGSFPSGQVYTLTLTADIALDDGLTYPAQTLATFGPYTPFLKASHNLLNEDGDEEIIILFDSPMEPTSTYAALQITPPLSATHKWVDAQTLTLMPNIELGRNLTYQIEFDETAELATGQVAFATPFQYELRTSNSSVTLSAAFGFGSGANMQVVQADGRRAVQFTRYAGEAASHDGLLATLHPLTPAQLIPRLEMVQNTNSEWDYYGSTVRRFRTSELEVAYSWPLTDIVRFNADSPAHEFTIPTEVPAGLYVLSLRQDGVLNDQLLLAITQNTVVAKRARDSVLVWVTAIGGEAKANLPVQIFATDGSLLATGTTDDGGRAQFTLPPNSTPAAVLAQDGNDYTLVNIRSWSYWDNNSGGQRSEAFTANIYTDRPLYQPGHTVYYKAILRRDDDAILSNVGAGVTATVIIRDPRQNIIHTATVTSNEFGTFNGQFALAEGGMLGNYLVSLEVGVSNGRPAYTKNQTFKVEDYRKPDYTVSVTLDRPYYLPGDPVTATVSAQYFFGQPVNNANVEATFFQSYVYYYSYDEQPEPEPLADQETDMDGTTAFSFTAPAIDSEYGYGYWYGRIPSTSYLLQVAIDDGSGQAVAAFVPVRVYHNSEAPSVTVNYWQRPDTPFNVGVLVQGIEGNPIAGRQVSFELLVYQNNSFSGLLEQTKTLTTAEDGRATHSLTLPDGYYQLRVSGQDPDGRAWQTERQFYVSPRNTPWVTRPRTSQLSLELDQEEYAPGDVAQLAIHSTVSGPALLTWQRGTIRGSEPIELTAPLTVVPVPVTAADAPNVILNVTTWLTPSATIPDYVSYSLRDVNVANQSINLIVPPNDKLLNVAIVPQGSQFAPRQEVTVAVQVTNFKGEPVSAELSLGMVDEAIYSLSADLSQPLYDSFYFRRASQVSSYHSFVPTRFLDYGGGMGGGGGEEGYGQEPRAEFPDTAAWFPALHTDANGLVTVTLTLPDSLTSWRLTARAVTADTQIGETTTNITVTQPVLVRPILPRTLTAGDDVLISVMAQNYLTTGVNLELELLSSDPKLLTITDETTQTVALFPDQRRTLGWSLSAEAAGEVQLTVIARQNGVVYDAIQLPLTIQPLAVRDVQAQVGQLTAGTRTLTLDLPTTALPVSTVNLELSRSIAGTMLEGLEYLTGFPYGCVEQTMSRALPNAVVGRAFNQLGYNTDLLAGLNEPINAGIQKLYGFQHDDGGWGWWHDDDTDGYQTAWVVFGLLTTAEAGHFVDPGVVKRGADWLLDNSASMDVNTRAFALYALARAAQYEGVTLEEESAVFILDQITVLRDFNNAQLNTFSQTALALALWEMGEETAAQDLLDEILATAETSTQTGATHWSGANHDGYYHNKTMASDTRTTAFVVTAMSQMRPTADELPGAVRYLLGRRQAQGWGTTNETAFAILALTDYLLAQRTTQGDAPFNYTVQVNGQTVAQGSLTPTAESITIPLPLDLLDVGANEITLIHDGVGPLYYALRNEWYLAQTSIEAAGSLTVKRTYWDVEGEPFDIANAEAGQLVLVRLEVTNPEDLSYVIIEDKLPGGLEALNSRLNSQPRGLSYWENVTYYWREYGYNYKEVFADRVSFFVTTLPDGRHIYEYTARVTHTGQFTALPAEAYAMYDLEQWGRSASDLWGGGE